MMQNNRVDCYSSSEKSSHHGGVWYPFMISYHLKHYKHITHRHTPIVTMERKTTNLNEKRKGNVGLSGIKKNREQGKLGWGGGERGGLQRQRAVENLVFMIYCIDTEGEGQEPINKLLTYFYFSYSADNSTPDFTG